MKGFKENYTGVDGFEIHEKQFSHYILFAIKPLWEEEGIYNVVISELDSTEMDGVAIGVGKSEEWIQELVTLLEK